MEVIINRGGCPNCGGSDTHVFHRIAGVPVNSCLLFDKREAAQALDRGDIDLSFCRACEFVYNASWKPDQTTYCEQYEETQAFSQTFSAYNRRQAEDLVARYAIVNKDIVEIGCGKGEFLSLLCELGGNRGVGYDPSFVPSRHTSSVGQIEFRRELFGPSTQQSAPDLVCCKMTLEHIHQTKEFVEDLRRIVSPQRGTILLIQVPDVRRILHEAAFWDVYYEHCSYFSPASLSLVLRKAGFDVLRVDTEFGGQYLTIAACASPGPNATPRGADVITSRESLANSVAYFARTAEQRAGHWGKLIRGVGLAGGKVVLWGSGSKAVAFLAATKADAHVQYLVDINPYRWGKFVPGSGTKIVQPDFLAQYQPDVVIAMNPIYETEIKDELARLGCAKAMFRAVGSAAGEADMEFGLAPTPDRTFGSAARNAP